MKKIICTVASIMMVTTLMVGCKAKTTDVQSTQAAQSTQASLSTATSNKEGSFQKADLEGEVAAINGSKITLKVIKTPEPPAKPTENSQGDSQKNAPKDADKEKPQTNNENGQAPKAPQDMKVEYTGETKDITIAAGIKITAMSRGQQGPEAKEITVSDIKVGDTLQITYSDKEKQTISQINVRSAVKSDASTTAK